MTKRRSFTNAQRGKIVRKVKRLINSGQTWAQACGEAKIDVGSYYRWSKNLERKVNRGSRNARTQNLINGVELPGTVRIGNTIVIKGTFKFVPVE